MVIVDERKAFLILLSYVEFKKFTILDLCLFDVLIGLSKQLT